MPAGKRHPSQETHCLETTRAARQDTLLSQRHVPEEMAMCLAGLEHPGMSCESRGQVGPKHPLLPRFPPKERPCLLTQQVTVPLASLAGMAQEGRPSKLCSRGLGNKGRSTLCEGLAVRAETARAVSRRGRVAKGPERVSPGTQGEDHRPRRSRGSLGIH